ncbi:hypothetical protein ABC977_05245 [Thioalkalicoccus limnaeus]|uniref:PepSY domain-containing protein n=1 Tax=Thioalkalicoccus limnaeus TaxID=120681 RepID=A0ABV4BE76_9GAMM
MKRLTVLLLVVTLTLLGQVVEARRDGGNNRGGLTERQAAEAAQRQTGGQVLSVKPASNGYRVRVLTRDGEVREIVVPDSGR